jgi:ABC-type Fe3+/spermidine/putrescine transport system ATPase subunit
MIFSIDATVQLGDFVLSVDFSVSKGEFFTLIGPSGCGKTTTLRLIAGFIAAKTGSITLDNRDITDAPPEKRNIGFVFQDYALFPHMNVHGNVAYGPKMKRWSKEEIESAVRSNLDLVHLTGFSKRNTGELSGGEQQRTALARALAPRPDLLLLDEPLSALDANLRTRLRREIREVQQYTNLPTIYVTHDQGEALALSDRIAIMNEGSIIQTGTPQELYRYPDDMFTARFLGASNIIPCRITGDHTITTQVGAFRVDTVVPSGKERQQKEHYLFFRPESCTIRPGPEHLHQEYNTFEVVPAQIEYHGAHFLGAAPLSGNTESEDEQMWVHFISHHELERDKAYLLTVPPQACRVLPG